MVNAINQLESMTTTKKWDVFCVRNTSRKPTDNRIFILFDTIELLMTSLVKCLAEWFVVCFKVAFSHLFLQSKFRDFLWNPTGNPTGKSTYTRNEKFGICLTLQNDYCATVRASLSFKSLQKYLTEMELRPSKVGWLSMGLLGDPNWRPPSRP